MSVINDSDFRSKLAAGTIGQFLFAVLGSGDTLTVPSAITHYPYGVSQQSVVSGEVCCVAAEGETKITAHEALAVGNIVGTSTLGKAQKLASTMFPRGRVVQACGSANDIAVIQLFNSAIAKA